MPLPYYLIDGYNLLHAAGLARATYGPGDLEQARNALLVRIADGLDDAERERTTVVFDAADPPPDAFPKYRFREMAVIYSVETGDADALIEDLIRRHSSPRQLRVVSDDVRLQRAAKRRAARAVKCEAFLKRLARREKSERQNSERCTMNDSSSGPAEADAAGQLEGWLEYFGLESATLDIEPPNNSPAESQGDRTSNRPQKAPVAQTRKGGAAPRRAGSPSKPTADPETGGPEPPAETLEFWQQRIAEALAEEAEKQRRKPS